MLGSDEVMVTCLTDVTTLLPVLGAAAALQAGQG